MVYYKPKRRHGKYIAGVIGLALLVVGGVITYSAFFKSDSGESSLALVHPPVTQVKAASTDAETDQQREANARALYRAVQDYRTNNKGRFPSKYADDRLSGGEGSVIVNLKFTHFTSVAFLQGTQRTMEVEALNVVIGAACSPSKDGSTVAASSGTGRGYVIQYIQRPSGTIQTKCLE